jgi:hypothetical protein
MIESAGSFELTMSIIDLVHECISLRVRGIEFVSEMLRDSGCPDSIHLNLPFFLVSSKNRPLSCFTISPGMVSLRCTFVIHERIHTLRSVSFTLSFPVISKGSTCSRDHGQIPTSSAGLLIQNQSSHMKESFAVLRAPFSRSPR